MLLNIADTMIHQNGYNIYIGDIETDETIYLDNKFMIIGNVKTKRGIVSKCDFMIIGKVETKSIYADKDFVCIGHINCDNVEIYGQYNIVYKEFTPGISIDEIIENKEKVVESKDKKIENKEAVVKETNKEIPEKNEEKILIGDYIIHKSYGKGEVISKYDDIYTVKFEDGERDMQGEWIIDSKFINKE